MYANGAAVPLCSLEFGWSAVMVLSATLLDAVSEDEAAQAGVLLAKIDAEVGARCRSHCARLPALVCRRPLSCYPCSMLSC